MSKIKEYFNINEVDNKKKVTPTNPRKKIGDVNRPTKANKPAKPDKPAKPEVLDKTTINWWNKHSEETQKQHVKDYPNSKISNLVNQGKLKYGKNADGSDKKDGEETKDVLKKDDAELIDTIETSGKSKKEIEKDKRLALAALSYNDLPDEIKDKHRAQGKIIAKVYADIVKKYEKKNRKLDKTVRKTGEEEENERRKDYPTKNVDFYKENPKMFLPKEKMMKFSNELYKDPRFHKRDILVLERFLNANVISNNTRKVSYFTEGEAGGAGQIASQTGELAAMVFCSLSDKEAVEMENKIRKHLEKRGGTDSNYPAQLSWLDSAVKARTAMKFVMAEIHGINPDEIKLEKVVSKCSWDTEAGVRSMGFKYSEKEDSTDCFFVIKDKNGKEIILEVSLKKSFAAKIINSGIKELADGCPDWDPNLKPEIYQQNMDKIYHKGNTDKKFKNALKAKIERVLKKDDGSELSGRIREEYKGEKDVEKIMEKLCSDKTSRGKRAILLFMHKELNDKIYDELVKTSRVYIKNLINQMEKNSKVKKYMMDEIKKEIPLHGILAGKEILIADEYALTKKGLKQIFGTDDWNEITENISFVNEKNTKGSTEYNLVYSVKGKTPPVKIAKIGIREDGVGYGYVIKFELDFYNKKTDKSGLTSKVREMQPTKKKEKEKRKLVKNNIIFDILNKDLIQEEKTINEKLRDYLTKK